MKKLLTAIAIFATLTAAQADPQARLQSVEFDQAAVAGGQAVTARVVLAAPAQDQNTWVELRGSDPLHAPVAVRIPAGHKEVTFTVSTDPVDNAESARLVAGVNGHYLESGALAVNDGPQAATR